MLHGHPGQHPAQKSRPRQQEGALKDAQNAFAGSAFGAYKDFSDAIDFLSGAVGKSTGLGKQILALRGQFTGGTQLLVQQLQFLRLLQQQWLFFIERWLQQQRVHSSSS